MTKDAYYSWPQPADSRQGALRRTVIDLPSIRVPYPHSTNFYPGIDTWPEFLFANAEEADETGDAGIAWLLLPCKDCCRKQLHYALRSIVYSNKDRFTKAVLLPVAECRSEFRTLVACSSCDSWQCVCYTCVDLGHDGWVFEYRNHFAIDKNDAIRDFELPNSAPPDLRAILSAISQKTLDTDEAVADSLAAIWKQISDTFHGESHLKSAPRCISGLWAHGWALDVHTLYSIPIDPDNHIFDTKRTEIGEAVYKLKYQGDQTQVEPIAATMVAFIRSRQELADLAAVLGVPPSNIHRPFQPVQAIAADVGTGLNLPVPTDYLLKTKQTTALKGMSDKQKRHEELEGAFRVADERFAGKHVVLVDDLFRSGETLNAVSAVLISGGKVGKVSVVTATITRSRR